MSDIGKYAVLTQRVDLFRGLRAEDVAKIFSKGMTIRVDKGETVFYKGTIGSQMYVVLGGKLGVYDGTSMIATLTVGDTFGEMALISEDVRSATVLAQEHSHLFVLNETTFHKLLTKRVAVQILLNVIKTISDRLRATNEKLTELQG